MFKGGNGKEETTNSPDRLNRIVEGTQIQGDIKSDSNFRLDGVLTGTIDTLGKLVIGPAGKIDGEIKCANADIEGEITGNIRVDGVLTLKSSARVTGNIITGKIEIHLGAQFNGNCQLGDGNSVNSKSQPANSISQNQDEPELVY